MSKGKNKTTPPLTDQISNFVKDQVAVQLKSLSHPITSIVSNGVMHMVNTMLQKLEKEITEKLEISENSVNSKVTTLNDIVAQLKIRSDDGAAEITYFKDQLAGLIKNNIDLQHEGKNNELADKLEDSINGKVDLLDHKISALESQIEVEQSHTIEAKNQLAGLHGRLSEVEKGNINKEFVISGLKVNKSAKEDTLDLLAYKLGICIARYEVEDARRASGSTAGKPPLIFVKLADSKQVSLIMKKKSELKRTAREVRIYPYLIKSELAMYKHTTEMFWKFKQRQPTAVVQFIGRFGIAVDGKQYRSNGTQLLEWGRNPG